MDIETLQIKRITANYDKHKTYVPKHGEFVLVDTPKEKNKKMLLVGDGVRTVDELYIYHNSSSADYVIPNMSTINELSSEVSGLKPADGLTQPITDGYGDNGKDAQRTKTASLNHTHQLTRVVAEKVLGITEDPTIGFACRRIRMGTLDPLTNDVGGKLGDIYIKY